MSGIVREWVEKAKGDLHSAERELRARKAPNHDAACFHAQQCAEKYLKAFLVHRQIPFRPIHDLEVLLGLITSIDPDFELTRDLLLLLNDYAVDFRYPGATATKDECTRSGQSNACRACFRATETKIAAIGSQSVARLTTVLATPFCFASKWFDNLHKEEKNAKLLGAGRRWLANSRFWAVGD